MFKRAVLTSLVLAAASCSVSAQEPLDIGFVYVSPIGDAGWTYQHEMGRQAMQAALEGKVTSRFVENVPEGAEAERVIRQFANSGSGLVFTTSFGYMNPTIKVAKQFPDVVFQHATGYKQADNVGTYNARFYEGRYLAGMVAGSMSESGVGGYVGAFPIPEVVMGINAFTMGMRAVNPDAEVKVIWVNSWYDPGKEREAADTLMAQGADVITHHTDSTAVVQAAEAQGKYAIGYHSDMSKYGPNAHLTAVTHHWDQYYTTLAQEVIDGTWTPRDQWEGIAAGVVKLAPISDKVPDDVKAKVAEVEASIADGSFHPFTGPVLDNTGTERLAAGEVITDEALLTTDWYVQGVQGELPQ